METITATEIPELYALWSALGALAAGVGRSRYTTLGKSTDLQDRRYPNLFIVLTGDVASGKSSAIMEMRSYLNSNISLTPDEECPDFWSTVTMNSGRSLLIAPTDLGLLIPISSLSRIKRVLNDGYDCSPKFGKATSPFHDVCTTMVAGAHITDVHNIFSKDWNKGLTSRIVMVWANGLYSDSPKIRDNVRQKTLKEFLHQIPGNSGLVPFSEAGRKAFNKIRADRSVEPAPHAFMESYWHSRHMICLKLSLLSAIDRVSSEITDQDVERADMFLCNTEVHFGKIFSHTQTNPFRAAQMDVLKWMATIKAAVPESDIKRKIGDRVPSDKVDKVFDDMLATKMIIENSSTDARSHFYVVA